MDEITKAVAEKTQYRIENETKYLLRGENDFLSTEATEAEMRFFNLAVAQERRIRELEAEKDEIEAAVTRRCLPYMQHFDSCNKYTTAYGLNEGTDRMKFDNSRKCTCGLDAIRSAYP